MEFFLNPDILSIVITNEFRVELGFDVRTRYLCIYILLLFIFSSSSIFYTCSSSIFYIVFSSSIFCVCLLRSCMYYFLLLLLLLSSINIFSSVWVCLCSLWAAKRQGVGGIFTKFGGGAPDMRKMVLCHHSGLSIPGLTQGVTYMLSVGQ